MRTKEKVKEVSPELVQAIDTVIHDFNNLHCMMVSYKNNEDNPITEYKKENGWMKSKEYYEKYGYKVKDRVKKMCDILYAEQED